MSGEEVTSKENQIISEVSEEATSKDDVRHLSKSVNEVTTLSSSAEG
jgi:hypothetical protein